MSFVNYFFSFDPLRRLPFLLPNVIVFLLGIVFVAFALNSAFMPGWVFELARAASYILPLLLAVRRLQDIGFDSWMATGIGCGGVALFKLGEEGTEPYASIAYSLTILFALALFLVPSGAVKRKTPPAP